MSYLRQQVAHRAARGRRGRRYHARRPIRLRNQLVYTAIYTRSLETGELFVPQPDATHQHLVALFDAYPRRLWTTNYDDLLEEAARLNGTPSRPIYAEQRQVDLRLAVTHLHGYLPPVRPDRPPAGPRFGPVILGEDDYHATTAESVGWTNREFVRLLDEYQVLVLGMSLTDPNLRRILATQPPVADGGMPRHWAVMTPVAPGRLRVPPGVPLADVDLARELGALRHDYWRHYGMAIVELPDHVSLLPFLVRLRYESWGAAPGALWRAAAERVDRAIGGWSRLRYEQTNLFLGAAAELLAETFGVHDPGEIVEIGVFLLDRDAETLVLRFRSAPAHRGEGAGAGGRRFSADPDAPTGLAGRVFISGCGVQVPHHHPLHDFGVADAAAAHGPDYAGIISIPIVDWAGGGLPLGVLYVTVTTTDGVLFGLRPQVEMPAGEPSLDGLYAWLADLALRLLE